MDTFEKIIVAAFVTAVISGSASCAMYSMNNNRLRSEVVKAALANNSNPLLAACAYERGSADTVCAIEVAK